MECELESAPPIRAIPGMGWNSARGNSPAYNVNNRVPPGITRTILIAIEDTDEVSVLSYGLKAAGIRNPIAWFKESTALIDHLTRCQMRERIGFENSPLLLALDTSLESHGGIETLKWIRQRPQSAKLLTIAVTSTRHPEEIESVYKAGAHWHLSRSTDFTDLMRLVRRIREFWTYAVKPDFCERRATLEPILS